MTWLILTLGIVALAGVMAWRRAARRRQQFDPAAYQALSHLYTIRRRLDVALFKQQLSGDMAEARRRLRAELDDDQS